MTLDEQLASINAGTMFFCGLDSDAILVSLAAGGDVPFSAAWNKNGYRAYRMDESEDYHPISRDLFMELVKIKEPLI